jgi:hypothetical protein
MVDNTKPKKGRPLKPAEPGKTSNLTLTVAGSLKTRLATAAQESGRTQSREAEVRLEDSFRDQDRAELFHDVVYGREIAALLELLGYAVKGAVQEVNLFRDRGEARVEGLSHPVAFNAIRAVCMRVLDALEPKGAGSAGGAEMGDSETMRVLDSIATPPTEADNDEHSRFATFVRDKFEPASVARVAEYLKEQENAEIRAYP